jgi:enamine deaminase RidA (YjgF/YER057c/UK114 family)
MQALEAILYSLAGIGAWTCISSLTIYLRDRSGNSGRSSHWAQNTRLDGPDEKESAINGG